MTHIEQDIASGESEALFWLLKDNHDGMQVRHRALAKHLKS